MIPYGNSNEASIDILLFKRSQELFMNACAALEDQEVDRKAFDNAIAIVEPISTHDATRTDWLQYRYSRWRKLLHVELDIDPSIVCEFSRSNGW